jgi:hypothetical protein
LTDFSSTTRKSSRIKFWILKKERKRRWFVWFIHNKHTLNTLSEESKIQIDSLFSISSFFTFASPRYSRFISIKSLSRKYLEMILQFISNVHSVMKLILKQKRWNLTTNTKIVFQISRVQFPVRISRAYEQQED